mgnify:CR=1 FL=1
MITNPTQRQFIDDATAAIGRPEVQAMIERLASFGLGVCIPHMHDPNTGAFAELPTSKIQLEAGLKVRFVDRAELGPADVPVAWRWNHGLKVVQACRVCRPDGPHH